MHRFVRSERQWTHVPHSGREERHDVVSGRDERHSLPHALDDAGAFVTQHARCVPGRIGSRRGVEVGVADPARDEPHEDLAGPRLGELDRLDDERAAELLEHRGTDLHGAILRALDARLRFLSNRLPMTIWQLLSRL